MFKWVCVLSPWIRLLHWACAPGWGPRASFPPGCLLTACSTPLGRPRPRPPVLPSSPGRPERLARRATSHDTELSCLGQRIPLGCCEFGGERDGEGPQLILLECSPSARFLWSEGLEAQLSRQVERVRVHMLSGVLYILHSCQGSRRGQWMRPRASTAPLNSKQHSTSGRTAGGSAHPC